VSVLGARNSVVSVSRCGGRGRGKGLGLGRGRDTSLGPGLNWVGEDDCKRSGLALWLKHIPVVVCFIERRVWFGFVSRRRILGLNDRMMRKVVVLGSRAEEGVEE
jgi:hypothetical protein